VESIVTQTTLRFRYCIWLMACGSCVKPHVQPHLQMQPETVSPSPLAGWTCFETSKTRGSRQDLVARFVDALRKVGAHPAIADTLPLRLVVGGRYAPAGSGTATERAARLYMGVFGIREARVDSVFPTWYTVSSGIYSAPEATSDAERARLYKQAYRFAQSVLVIAKLDTLHCGT
jgi:hypothetical protein